MSKTDGDQAEDPPDEDSADEPTDEHLQDVPVGAGCTEIWETLSERREESED